MRGLSLVAASEGHSSSWCAGLSLSRSLLLRSTGSRRAGSVIVAHGPSCSAAYGIFPDRGLNPCALHWQADSQPLRHQGSPLNDFWPACPPPRNIWQCSHFWLSQKVGRKVLLAPWVERSGKLLLIYSAQDISSQQKIIQLKVSVVLLLRNLDIY